MSQAIDRIPVDRAFKVVEHLGKLIGLPQDTLIAGSIRRGIQEVGDIELVFAAPATGEPDPILEKILEHFQAPGIPESPEPEKDPEEASMFDPFQKPVPAVAVLPGKSGFIIKGAKPGWKYCQLCIPLRGGPRAVVNVDLFRYVAGPQGNRGWIELIRTGPRDFGIKACAQWKRISGGGKSDQGFPRLTDGRPVFVPSEEAAFDLLQWPWRDPRDRR